MVAPEDTGLFAVSPIYGDHRATRRAVESRIFLAQVRSPLMEREYPIGHGELMTLHRDIFGEGFPDLAGRQREYDIQVLGDPCSPPHLIGEHLARYCRELRDKLEDLERNPYEDVVRFETSIDLCVWAHVELLRIHPFPDGNGRVARVFMNLMLKRFGLRPIEVKGEDGYGQALRQAIHEHLPAALVALVLRLQAEELGRLLRADDNRRRRAQRHGH